MYYALRKALKVLFHLKCKEKISFQILFNLSYLGHYAFDRIMEYKEFKKKWAQTRTNPEFRAPWTRLSNALKELQDMRDCYEFTPTEQVSVLKPEHSRRLVRKTS